MLCEQLALVLTVPWVDVFDMHLTLSTSCQSDTVSELSVHKNQLAKQLRRRSRLPTV